MKLKFDIINRNFFVLILGFFFSFETFGQDFARVTTLSGSNPTFIFNSISKYNGGITLNNWTRLKLEMDASSHTSWALHVNSQTSNIQSEGGIAFLSLSTFEIRANIESENETANGGTLVDNSPVILVYDGVGYGSPLLSGTFTGDGTTNLEVILTISYDCGTTGANKLLGKAPEYYFVDLVFTLTSTP